MATLKKYLAFMLGGALLGAVIASLIAPGMISWYHDPGVGMPLGFNPAPFAREVASKLLWAQVIGAGVGSVLVLVLALVISLSRGKAKPGPGVSPPPGQPAP